jgi:alpha-tubulin suppressor-like RCC1 family protein
MGLLTTTGALYTWGLNNVGQLGDGTIVNKSSPVHIGLLSWSAVSAGSSYSLGLLVTTGALYAWGLNASYQLGDTTITNKSSPGTYWNFFLDFCFCCNIGNYRHTNFKCFIRMG